VPLASGGMAELEPSFRSVDLLSARSQRGRCGCSEASGSLSSGGSGSGRALRCADPLARGGVPA